MSRFAFARSPKWLFGHFIVLSLVAIFVTAGFWQLRRLGVRRAFNAVVEKNMAMPVTPIGEVLGPKATFTDVPAQLNRRVRLTGRYLLPQEVIISGQANNQQVPGVWSVSPLLLDDGQVVLVNRGWMPSTGGITSALPAARPPAGRVTVVGLVSETQLAISGESKERNLAYQPNFLRIDVARIQKQFDQKLVPAFVQRTAQSPGDPGPVVPQALPLPELDDGPNLGYAEQWFSFTALALIAYPILLIAVAHDREKKLREDGAPDELPPGAFIGEDGIIDMTAVEKS